MKTNFTHLLATLLTSSAFAYDEGKITITTAIKKDVQVYMDDRLVQDNDNMIVLNNVRPGNHSIKIYRMARNESKRKNGNYRNGRNDRRDYDLLYSATVYVKPAYHVDVVINRFGRALVDEKALSDRNGNWDDDGFDDGGYDGGYHNGNNRAMSDQDFNQLLQRIRNQWFGRLGNARDAFNNNYFNTYQVKQILQLFSSESDKLELAKLSYRKIVDRQNFRQLYELFSYQSQADLDRYIREAR
jgi:hypothetical protein